jgi:hypothetical protein
LPQAPIKTSQPSVTPVIPTTTPTPVVPATTPTLTLTQLPSKAAQSALTYVAQQRNIPAGQLAVIEDRIEQLPNWIRNFQVVTIQDKSVNGQTYHRWVDLYSGEIIENVNSVQKQVESKLQKLAAATGRDVTRLQLADESAATLLNGRKIVSLKAVDKTNGEIVGKTFEGDMIVDEQTARVEAGSQWRKEHGALTPELVKKLATLKPDEKISIAIWFVVEITPLLQADRLLPSQPNACEKTPEQIGCPQYDNKQPLSSDGIKQPAIGTPWAQVPEEIKARIAIAGSTTPTKAPELSKSEEEIKQKESNPSPAIVSSNMSPEDVKAFQEQNLATLRSQIAPVREHFVDLLHTRGLTVKYVSDLAPIIYLEATRSQVEDLANLSGIDAIYFEPNTGGPSGNPSLSSARPSQNVNLINDVGYNGNNIGVAVVEGERIFPSNPFLPVAGTYDSSQATADHPTWVGGIIKSTDTLQRGLAASATLYSANGSYILGMSGAMDWGSTNANILNNSYYWPDNGSSASFYALDRQADYIVRYANDFVVVAAGNSGASTGCTVSTTPYVASPGKGFNVMTVGDHTDNDPPSWVGNSMAPCSSYGNPGDDTSSFMHDKPEVAAVGENLNGTITTAPWIGQIGSGTSQAAPMVSALAADLIGANASLATKPAAIRSIIMATALHNIEGDQRLSEKDGVGSIDATAAIAIVERGDWSEQSISSASNFPINVLVFAYKNERVRFVANWLANTNATYNFTYLPADLDISAYRANGSLIALSSSIANSFEIVDFVAPDSEWYMVTVRAYSYSGGDTRLGMAWWRGLYRISPNTGYNYPAALPLGNHFSVFPSDWGATFYWRAFAVRSHGSDHDLTLNTASWFDDPGMRVPRASSLNSGAVDFIMVDGNHRGGQSEHYRVNKYSGTGDYSVNWSNQFIYFSGSSGTTCYGPYSMGPEEVVKVFDVLYAGYQGKRISIVPNASNVDLGAALYQSNSNDFSTWTQGRALFVAIADAYGVGNAVELLKYDYANPNSDYLGLAVFNNTHAATSFNICIESHPLALTFLPLVIR